MWLVTRLPQLPVPRSCAKHRLPTASLGLCWLLPCASPGGRAGGNCGSPFLPPSPNLIAFIRAGDWQLGQAGAHNPKATCAQGLTASPGLPGNWISHCLLGHAQPLIIPGWVGGAAPRRQRVPRGGRMEQDKVRGGGGWGQRELLALARSVGRGGACTYAQARVSMCHRVYECTCVQCS